MPNLLRFASPVGIAVLLWVGTTITRAANDKVWDYSVQVSCEIEEQPARITLNWLQDSTATPAGYTIYRKAPGATSWGSGTALPGTATSYNDTAVTAGTKYEYRIVKAARNYTGYGYIEAGIKAPLVDDRGAVLLLVDNRFSDNLRPELERLMDDLAGDGWSVIRRDVSAEAKPPEIKAIIKGIYAANSRKLKSLFLFGHIPVAYSGKFNPDGHPDHVGAWPADAYYGDMDGTWTDSQVEYTQTLNTDPTDAARVSNHIGDGKFDQTELPSAVELEVGRVDLFNLPGRTSWQGPATFPSELELLRNYLNRDHNFRHRVIEYPRRAVLGDYFGIRGGEAFAASGYRAFAPLVGPANMRNLNIEFSDKMGVWIEQLAKADYLLAYACGAGSYRTIAGLGHTGFYYDGSTTELVSHDTRAVFNLLFGSWLGDWDHEDNMLRAPLATSTGLVSVWSGRPHWFIHPLGLGDTIGATARLTQNNDGLYETQINTSAHRVHIALMGDPTLRLHPVAPVSQFTGTIIGSTTALSWKEPKETGVVGYHVYRRDGAGNFIRLTKTPVTGSTFNDTKASMHATYMVRAIKLEQSPSGSYYNASQGIFWTADVSTLAPGTITSSPATNSSDAAPTPTGE